MESSYRRLAVAQVRHQLVVLIQDSHAAVQVGNKHHILLCIKAAGTAHIVGKKPLVVAIERHHLKTLVGSVSNIKLRLGFARIYPDAMRAFELAGTAAGRADNLLVRALAGETVDNIAAVALADVHIAVRPDRQVRGLVKGIEPDGGGADDSGTFPRRKSTFPFRSVLTTRLRG